MLGSLVIQWNTVACGDSIKPSWDFETDWQRSNIKSRPSLGLQKHGLNNWRCRLDRKKDSATSIHFGKL